MFSTKRFGYVCGPMMCLCCILKLLLVIGERLIYFMDKDWDLRVSITKLISVGDFGQYVLGDEFSLFSEVASWDKVFVCFDKCACD